MIQLVGIALSLLLLVSCTTTVVKKEPKSTWKVLNQNTSAKFNSQPSNFVPSGTELIFATAKTFDEKNNNLNIELSPEKRCNLSTNLEKDQQAELTPNTVLTVVGYRGETGELVLSEPSYQQYYLSCVGKAAQKRKTSSVVKKAPPGEWKKASINLEDIKKMSPLLKVKFIPQ